MNHFIRNSFTLFALTLSLIPVSAQKKGQFSPDNIRPERLKQEQVNETNARPIIVDQVRPKNFTSGLKIVEALPMIFNKADMQKAATPRKSPRVLGDGTTIYGSLIYSNSWAGTNGSYGVYSFPASSYSLPELVYSQGSLEANGGGCYHDGKYYWSSFVYTQEMGYTFTTFCSYDFSTKEFNKNILSFINEDFDLQQITNAMTYDPTTNRIFALANIKVVDETGFIAKYYPSFSEVDPYTGFVTPIAQIPSMVAIASTPSGEIYAISRGDNASLYRINKNSGDLTLIGATGLSTEFAQSMTFDPITGKLYWAAVRSNGLSGLYEVDVKTGVASLIFNFENNEEYTGLYIPAPTVDEAAPAAVSEIVPSFVDGSLSGSVSVTAPEKTFAGTTLTSPFSLTILIDGENAQTKEVTAGEKVTLDYTLAEGIHSFTAYASNTAGEGPRTAKAVYVGIDAPAAVGELTLSTTDDGKAHLSWSAPTAGRNEGYIDPAQITYTVKRYPDNVVVAKNITATYFTDPVDKDADNYWFEVTPFCGDREGIPAQTETGIFGHGTGLPCHFSLATKEEFDLFTVIDANKDWDGQYNWGGWMYGPDFKFTTEEDGNCAVYGYHPESAADDWLITPPVGVEKGKKYRLTYSFWTKGQPETLEVTAGPQNTIAAQKVILPKADYSHKDHKVFDVDFTAEADGNYYIGFHITSKKKQFYAFVSDIKVDAVPEEDSPVAVSDLTATPDANGENKVSLSFTAPSKTIGGQDLDLIEKIEVYHGTNQDPVATLQGDPGEEMTWTEANISGMVDYRVVPFANGKSGEKAEVSVYVGWDIPVAISVAEVSDATGAPVVTWGAPAEGVNGGYIDPSKLTYAVYRFEDNLELLDKNVSGTIYTDSSLSSKPQHLVAYVIVPHSQAGYGEPVSTDYIVFGDPYKGEFLENFAEASVHSTPWVMYRLKGNTQNWGVTSYGSNPTCSPVGNDGGMAVYGTDGRVGDEGLLASPKLDISNIENPVLSFYLYHNYTEEHAAWNEAFEDRLIPEVILPDGSREALHEPIYVDDLGTGWLKYTCNLDKYKTQPYIRIAMHGITACEQDVYVDHILVSNLISNDLQVYAFTGSTKVEAGKNATYKLTVYNRGANDVDGDKYQVILYDGSNAVETLPGRKIASKEYVTFSFDRTYTVEAEGSVHQMWAEIEFDDDQISNNNVSDKVMTKVTDAILPEVSSLTADIAENNISLNWSKPDARHTADSFEEYTPFEIEDFAGYHLVDGDKNYTWSFQDIYFDNEGQKQAFMVFNPVALGIVDKASALFPYDAFDPRTGNQVLACFQGLTVNSDGTGVSAKNDDWFISPEVFGDRTISFYAKAGDVMQGVDKFEVLYSSTDNNTSSFKPLSEVITTDGTWTRHEFTLPASARYFAIHCVSDDGFILFIDDLEFVEKRLNAPVPHTGYRLYRDGVMISELPASTTSFADNALADGIYKYHLTALYENGKESGKSNTVEIRVGNSGVEEINANVKVTAVAGAITVTANEDSAVKVVSADGKSIYSGSGASHRIPALKGVYVVTIDNKPYRVIVK